MTNGQRTMPKMELTIYREDEGLMIAQGQPAQLGMDQAAVYLNAKINKGEGLPKGMSAGAAREIVKTLTSLCVLPFRRCARPCIRARSTR